MCYGTQRALALDGLYMEEAVVLQCPVASLSVVEKIDEKDEETGDSFESIDDRDGEEQSEENETEETEEKQRRRIDDERRT